MSEKKTLKFRWFGLTGGIASGKSTISKMFVQAGIPVIDADVLAREVVIPGSPGLAQVVQAFGTKVLNDQAELDRKKLGQEVFGNPEALRRLENILHPLIQTRVLELRRQFEQQGHPFAIYDVPLLFEKQSQDQFEAVILVWCDPEVQKQRMKTRDQLSPSEIDLRLAAQVPIDAKRKLSDFVIDNSGRLEDLKPQFEKLLVELQSFAKA